VAEEAVAEGIVAQASEPAVSPISKSAARRQSHSLAGLEPQSLDSIEIIGYALTGSQRSRNLSDEMKFILFLILSIFFRQSPSDSPPGYTRETLSASNLSQAYPALFVVDRRKMGFPPLPTNAVVKVLTVHRKNWPNEYPPPKNYDVSFQFWSSSSFYPNISRFVALERTTNGFRWVGESLSYSGPQQHMVDESLIHESIEIICEIKQVTIIGENVSGTLIKYSGPDRRLEQAGLRPERLTISKIGPILREWGYDYDMDKLAQ
jgi:hypothetical protein